MYFCSPNLCGRMTFPCRRMITSWTTILTTISDPNLFTTILHKLMNKQTYIGMLRQGNTGAQILSILDAIAAPVAEENDQLNPLAEFGRSDEIDF